MKIASAFISILITTPIWFYLLYKMLEAVHASELMWFLFYLYIPAVIINLTIFQLIKEEREKKGG